MKRILLALAGVAALLVGLGFIMPAIALFHRNGSVSMGVMGPLALGTMLAGAGAVLFVQLFRHRAS